MQEVANTPQNKNMSGKSSTANMYICYICKARFSDRNECKQHMQSHTKKEIKPDVQNEINTLPIGRTNSQNAVVEGKIEDIGFKIKEEAKDEESIENSEGYYDSNYLLDILDVKKEYKPLTNIITSKDNLEMDNSDNELSDKDFSQKELLDRYTKAQSGERPHKCNVCDDAFFFEQHLNKHIEKMHNWEIPLHCSFCDKTYMQKRIYDIHMERRHGERPYQCTQCDKAYLREDNLRSHTLRKHPLLHNEKRPFKCGHCDRSFIRKGYLDNHLKTHIEEIP